MHSVVVVIMVGWGGGVFTLVWVCVCVMYRVLQVG